MTSAPRPLPPPADVETAIDFINRSLADVCTSSDAFENPRRFSGYATRLQLLLNTLLRSSSLDSLFAPIQTALKGIAGDLALAVETVSVYRKKSKIFVLIQCQLLSASLQQQTVAIGAWLALIESCVHDNVELRKRVVDLSRDMKQAHFKVTENEERVQCTLQREGEGRQTTKAVQSAIVMDLARALGIEPENYSELSEQVKLFKNDVAGSYTVTQRRILVSLERILDNWSTVPDMATMLSSNVDFEEEKHISSPFKNFLCPLTKEVMKNPVVLESSQTYERTAIVYWFQRCLEDGREPTCPVTGQVLKSMELKPNIGLAGAIEEWINRNVEIEVKYAVEKLSVEPPVVDSVEKVLDSVYRISEEHPYNRYRVRNAGIVVLIVRLLRNSCKSIGSLLRSKALMALLSMAKDEESKKIMLEEGVTRLAVNGLIGSSEKEREHAVKLVLEFCTDEACCIKIASEKGALVLLSTMAGNLEHPALSNLAEGVLKKMEKVEAIIQSLAEAGRFEPLLSRLCEGPDDVKIEMASMVGKMTLTNTSKQQIARLSAKILVELMSKPEGRAQSLQALHNLSGLDDNASILVDSAALPALMSILFDNQDALPEMKELAASTIANIVSNPGHWELASADKNGHSLQSASVVSSLLGLLSVVSPQCQVSILHILYGIASSPQAVESVATHIKTGDGIEHIIQFLEHPEVEHRIYAFGLTRVLSERFGEDLASELKASQKLTIFKDKLLDNQSTDGERSDSACVLANLPLSQDEVKALLGTSFVKWTITRLKSHHGTTNARISRRGLTIVEGLLGLLLHYTRSLDPETLSMVKEHHLMTIFCEQLGFPSRPRVKQLAALGLKNLSESGRSLAAGDPDPPPRQGFCAPLIFICGRSSPLPSTCPMHNAPCEDDSQLCLLKSNSIKPLIDLLTEDDTSVQIAAMEALSTLVPDNSSILKRASDELEQQGVINAVIDLFIELRPGELQERTLWMIERILRVEGHNHRYSLNQSLVRALVEAFRHGNADARRHAQNALTNLKQLSAVSGQTSSHTRPQA